MAVSKVSGIKTTEVTVSIGTEKYDSYYFADKSVKNLQGQLLNAYVYSSKDNHYAAVQFCQQSKTTLNVFLRVISNTPNSTVVIKILTL